MFPPSIRENSPGRLAPRDRRLGKWTALLAGCLLRVGRPDGARREARLAYLRGPNIYIAKLIEALAATGLAKSTGGSGAYTIGTTSSVFDVTSNAY